MATLSVTNLTHLKQCKMHSFEIYIRGCVSLSEAKCSCLAALLGS